RRPHERLFRVVRLQRGRRAGSHAVLERRATHDYFTHRQRTVGREFCEPAGLIMEDFFISYNKADKVWAEGLANWLDQAMFTTILQEQDFVAGSNFVSEMHHALKSAK